LGEIKIDLVKQMATRGRKLLHLTAKEFAMLRLLARIVGSWSDVQVERRFGSNLGQRAIFSLDPALRGRLNALFIVITFIGGAFGSAIGAWAFARGDWALTTWIGLGMPTLALLVFLTETRAPAVARRVLP